MPPGPAGTSELDLAALAEDVQIDLERRKEILRVHSQLASATHYVLLGIPWGSPAVDARRAYLEKVKLFHPDRFAGKRLGSFRTRLEQIFHALTDASEVLADDARRERYAAESAPPEVRATQELRRLEDELRSDERRARLTRMNPGLARAARVSELLKRGKAALAAGNFGAAKNDFLVAAGLDPKNAELRRLTEESKQGADAHRAAEAVERAQKAEVLNEYAEAFACYRQAAEHDPREPRWARAAVRAGIKAGTDPKELRPLAEAAARAAPDSAAAHALHGEILALMGLTKEARKEIDRALAIDPGNEDARARLKKLRWSFLK